MSIQWVVGSPQEFINTPQKALGLVTKNFNMEALVEDAAGMMKDLIASRGTNRQWSRAWNGRTHSGPGRIDTGNMYEAVTWWVSPDGYRGEFGWLNNREPYFLYQEEGFPHWITGEMVPAMLALQDAGLAAQEDFVRRLTQAVKNG